MATFAGLPQTSLALRGWIRAATSALSVYLAISVLGLGALGFLVAAFFLWLLPALGGAAAAALTGIMLLAVAALIFGIYQNWKMRHHPIDPTVALSRDVMAMIRARPLDAVLMALTAGVSAGTTRR